MLLHRGTYPKKGLEKDEGEVECTYVHTQLSCRIVTSCNPPFLRPLLRPYLSLPGFLYLPPSGRPGWLGFRAKVRRIDSFLIVRRCLRSQYQESKMCIFFHAGDISPDREELELPLGGGRRSILLGWGVFTHSARLDLKSWDGLDSTRLDWTKGDIHVCIWNNRSLGESEREWRVRVENGVGLRFWLVRVGRDVLDLGRLDEREGSVRGRF